MRALKFVCAILAVAMAPAFARPAPDSFADLTAKLLPTVVNISTTQYVDRKKTDDKPKVDEKAYNEALKRIPEPKEKYDPWSGARPATADQKTDQKTK